MNTMKFSYGRCHVNTTKSVEGNGNNRDEVEASKHSKSNTHLEENVSDIKLEENQYLLIEHYAYIRKW